MEKNKVVLDFLEKRASVRKFDPQYKISFAEIQDILRLAANAPSGNNTQPWKVVAVTNKAVQAEIRKMSYSQVEVENASGIFLVFGDPTAYDISGLAAYHLANQLLSLEDVAAFENKMKKFFELSPSDHGEEALKLDCGLFSMNLLSAICSYGYDAVPMRGVNFKKIKAYFELPEEWLPILMIPFGKATELGNPKVRKAVADFTIFID